MRQARFGSMASLAFLAVLAFLLLASRVARAAENTADRAEDAFEENDLDREDLGHLINRNDSVGRRTGAGDLRDESWISLVGFGGTTSVGQPTVGAMAVVGIAFDRIAAGPMHRTGERPMTFAAGPPLPPVPAPVPASVATPAETAFVLDGHLARAVVAAAWRASGMGTDDARIDAMVARARASAALPETRLRVLKQISSGSEVDGSIDDSRYYDTIGSGLWLEARVTWRLDRLLYADDEPTLERVRLEREDARLRLATHVMDALVAWQRARLDVATSTPGTREAVNATLREIEAAAMLDVLTAGKFAVLTGPNAQVALTSKGPQG